MIYNVVLASGGPQSDSIIHTHVHVCYLCHLSCVQLFAIPWTVAPQSPLSMGFSRQEYWSGCHSLLQGIFLTQGLNAGLLHCRQILYHLSHQGSSSQNKHAQPLRDASGALASPLLTPRSRMQFRRAPLGFILGPENRGGC